MHPLALLIPALAFVVYSAAAGPASAPASSPAASDYTISEMRVQTLPGFTYVCGSAQTTFADMAKPITTILDALQKAADAQKFQIAGPAMFIYHIKLDDCSKPFLLEIGFKTLPGTKAPEGFGVPGLEAGPAAATILLSGSLQHMEKAYDKLTAAMDKAGLKPGAESRETYLNWEGPESVNNIVLIQIPIEN